MKNLIFLFVAILLITSCENLEDNSPVLQAKIGNSFFKSDYKSAEYFPEGDFFVIEGIANDEIVKLRVNNTSEGSVIEFSENSTNFATFEKLNGVIYSTANAGGGGKLIFSEIDNTNDVLTGEFNFLATSAGLDTLTVSSGVFYKIPYVNGSDDPSNPGSFSSEINGNPFIPSIINANNAGSSIIIEGVLDLQNITLIVPIDVEEGTYELPQNGFSASYENDLVIEEASEGNIVVVSHNLSTQNITGTFSFLTENNIITLGQFDVSY